MHEPTARDRNWNELLQELRVTQTGLQILTAFLVTLPFHNRFTDLSAGQTRVYLAVLATAVAATVLVLAPVNYHRWLFRRQQKDWLVLMGNRCARVGLALAALAVTGVMWLLFDFVLGSPAGHVAGLVTLLCFMAVWVGIPLVRRRADVVAPTPSRSPREQDA